MKAHLVFCFIMLLSSFALAAKAVPECRTKPDFVNRSGTVLNLKSLPQMILIGKKAEHYVENKSTGIKIWGVQSFKKGNSKLICATPSKAENESFSIYAPTLIDLTNGKTIGDSYWQFHMIANSKQFGIWNKKSRLFPKTKDLESGLAKIGAHIQIMQHSRDEFEMLFTRETESTLEVLSIRFDAVSGLQ